MLALGYESLRLRRTTTRVVLVVLAVAATMAVTADPSNARSPGSLADASKDPLIIAHRGFSAQAPENTLPAVRAGIRSKADFVEVDVQRTKDNKLVILHDQRLTRTTNVEDVYPSRKNDKLETFTFAEIRKLDAGSWKGATYAGTKIPTLKEVLRSVAGSRSKLLLELKSPASYPGIEKQSARQLRAFGMIRKGTGDKVQVQSFDAGSVETFDRLEPEAEVGILFSTAPADPSRYTWAEAVNPSYRTVDRAYVRKARKAGLLTFVYTVDNPVDIRRMARIGVDGIVTNDPDTAYLALR